MTDNEPTRPRRALPPVSPDEVPTSGRFARATWTNVSSDDDVDFGEDDPLTVTGTRFLALSHLDDEDEDEASTPVPPPAPVLPSPPLADGRRYSSATPNSPFKVYAPRFSATTALTPASPNEPPSTAPTHIPQLPSPPFVAAAVSPPTPVRASVPAPTASAWPAEGEAHKAPSAWAPTPSAHWPRTSTPPVAAFDDVPASASAQSGQGDLDGGDASGDSPSKPRMSTRTRIIWATVAGVVALALVAFGIWAGIRASGPGGSGSPTPPAALSDVHLISAADLNAARPGTTWVVKDTVVSPSGGAPQPVCLLTTSDGLPTATNSLLRTIGADAGGTGALLQRVDTYADVDSATKVFNAKKAQLGGCTRTLAWIVGGAGVTGLADDATIVTVDIQNAIAEYHTLLLVRSGTAVSIVDATQVSAALTPDELLGAATAGFTRLCSLTAGACPSTPKAAAAPPPATIDPGWLATNDLPRITAGTGQWGATKVTSDLSVTGSKCENVDLNTPPGVANKNVRTYIMSNDPAAQQIGYGVDEVRYGLSDAAAATALADQLNANLAGCAARTPTATVQSAPAIEAAGEPGTKFSFTTYKVSQKVNDTKTISFRVAIVWNGARVVYLLANPANGYDFADPAWTSVVQRAGERLTQLP